MRTLVWFRGKDLRLSDHEPLASARKSEEVVPLFVLDPYFFAPERAKETPHRIQFLLESLVALKKNIAHLGSELVVVKGKSVDVVPILAKRWRVDRVVGQRWVAPFARERDRRVTESLEVPFELFDGETLRPPGTLRTGKDEPYSVFTAFARAFKKAGEIGHPIRAPKHLPPLPFDIRTRSVAIPSCEELGFEPNPNIQRGGERAARDRLERFLSKAASEYATDRDRMDLSGTSRLSADLKFGTLSPRTVWHAVERRLKSKSPASLGSYHNELVWREFTHSTLWDRPELLEEPFHQEWKGFPYEYDEAHWNAWVKGTTGYPIVDASARQLLGEGFVHNRARMISASFLTKHLLIDYRRGEAHYMRYLTDGDWAQNNAGWQWSAGCGCDAQPYFRVFNPVLQGEKFDPTGAYVRRWVPELADVPDKYIHRPWDAPEDVLEKAGVVLDGNYPSPIVNHTEGRDRFLRVASEHLGRSRGH
ncbi:MAG: deoxyribodipyrimidine photo-lyase [Polyangiaceae bacterium]|nr:deoxyribodipyrimidine photo-lyase [Polyangiaceae bacterium]